MNKRAHSLSGKYLTPAFDHHRETLQLSKGCNAPPPPPPASTARSVSAIEDYAARPLPGGGGDSPIFRLINQK